MVTPVANQPRESWHLSKSVPVSLIVVMLIQTVGIVWFASQLRSDVDVNQRDLLRLERGVGALEGRSNRQAVQLSRIEQSLKDIDKTLVTIERYLSGTRDR